MSRRLKVYLAGPEVFLPDAVAIGARKKALCMTYGFEGLFPFDNEVPPGTDNAAAAIYRANVAMIRTADLGIFNLTPFRGPSADVGTVFELGFLSALGKPAFGYTNGSGDLLSRIKQFTAVSFDAARDEWRDAAGWSVENFGNADNLMIDGALAELGQAILRPPSAASLPLADLAGFETCLRHAAAALAAAAPPKRRR